MEALMWVMLVFLIILLLLLITALVLKRKHKSKAKLDYYTFFVIGMLWFAFGIVSESVSLSVIGIAFMALGIAHKDRWQQNKWRWKSLSKKERNLAFIAIFTLSLILFLGVFLVLLAK
ncbi:hypothetical protein JXB11_01030 [Candidatus Woesearchaeota archaeon]|nr:hypothetical protein [Candidatus Woesearchaeota archaeon]